MLYKSSVYIQFVDADCGCSPLKKSRLGDGVPAVQRPSWLLAAQDALTKRQALAGVLQKWQRQGRLAHSDGKYIETPVLPVRPFWTIIPMIASIASRPFAISEFNFLFFSSGSATPSANGMP